MTLTFPKIIKTERLLLRPYRWDDINDLLNFSVEERWSRYIRAPYPYTQKDAQEFLADRVGLSRPDQDVWCLEIENRVVGDAGFGWHKKNSAAEIAYNLDPNFWNQGLTTEACNAIIDVAFNHDQSLNRIFAAIDTRNIPSVKVAQKLGMKCEGILRQNRRQKGKLIDEAWYSILRKEWLPK